MNDKYGVGYTSNTDKPFIFDLEDYELIKEHCWYESYDEYICTKYKGNSTFKLHRLITNCPKNLIVDHINHNKLDNRKENLRICTITQNNYNKGKSKNNTSKIIGLYWSEKDKKWRVRIMVNRKSISLGMFKNKDDAIKARLQAELKYFGEYAPQKHLFKQYGIEEP